jgi:hypothetical protein
VGGFTYIPNLVINSVTYPSMAPGAAVTVAGAGFLAGALDDGLRRVGHPD